MAASGGISFNEQLYNHIALPCNIPGREDNNLDRLEPALLTRLIDATRTLNSHVVSENQQHLRALSDSLTACQSLNVRHAITKSALSREFRNLQPGRMLILHVSAQNCGLLIYRQHSENLQNQVVFEAFEASATCEQVLATKNALLRDFPGCAVSVPHATFLEESFQESLTSFIQQASTEFVTKFASMACKAAADVPEIRNTSDPALVTGFLMTILEANGAIKTVPLLRKRVRDTVRFDQARKPWRRSPFYLVVRVAIQRYLYEVFGADIGRFYYKSIMCLMLRQFLEDSLRRLPFESVFYLRQKLGRRLAKLESDRTATTGNINRLMASTMSSLEPSLENTLHTTGGWLKATWRNYKRAHERIVPPLSSYVPASALNLRLGCSYPALTRILASQNVGAEMSQHTPDELLKQYEDSAASVKPYMYAARSHIQISQHHATVIQPVKESTVSGHSRILELGEIISDYVHQIQTSPEGYPDQKSQMLLHLMELWVLMDKETVACYPLLQDYHPGFDCDLLDPIQLLSFGDLVRVQQVQAHISKRYRARHAMQCKTIFDDPADDCFAVRYFDEYDESGHSLRLEIEDHADTQRASKEVEWEGKSAVHEEIIKKRDEATCIWDSVPSKYIPGDVEIRHRWPCEWHALQKEAKSMEIQICEHPLPSYEPAAKASLFELRCPKSFAAYRDATWSILSIICCPSPTRKPDRVSIIRKYSQLQPYANASDCKVALASERKAHLESHYAQWHFPVRLQDLIRTCGLKPRYYDSSTGGWTGAHGKASLWHHFPVMLAIDSPFRILQPTYANWPSSNEVQASQADCPADVSVHEFMAWQGLLVGRHSRWLNLTREMGSTNLNFSSDATWTLVSRLVLEVGPASPSADPRRDVHTALLDDYICSKLLQQISLRLDAIHRNWREPVQMDILITILLKIVSLSTSESIREKSMAYLLQARNATDLWRSELQSVVTSDARVRPFAVYASLSCKRTLHTDPEMLLDPSALKQYVIASISLNYNLVEEFTFLPHKAKNAIIRDVLYSYENRELLRHSILTNHEAFVDAINYLWQIPEGYETIITNSATGTWWILLELRPKTSSHSYFVHYNYVYGTLLIDGQEMSTLPLTYRRHPLYRQMFGDKNPIVYPSPLQGMSWAVSEPTKAGQRIHLGFRQQTLVVRAIQHDQLYEYIPPEVFGTPTSADLPVPLISGCYHWLNIRSGDLEIRRQDMWISKLGNWWIHGIAYGQCQVIRRRGEQSETSLLEPSNDLVRCICKVFEYFEDPRHIIVFKSREGRLTVELKRLELSFHINNDGLLFSPRLGAVIPQNQDAGTWYGLRSKIVVQSAANYRQKNILVPLNSELQVTRDHIHVSVDIATGGATTFLKFDINDVLGRVDCPPEPRLLYTKALLHAYTSHVMPDPLTSRSGVEEALSLLKSGLYQPWSPLTIPDAILLQRLAELSPKRGYYPVDSQFMETVVWQPNMTVHMQDDRYWACADNILQRNLALSRFVPGATKQELALEPSAKPDSHLATRATTGHAHKLKGNDMLYRTRDKRTTATDRTNVLRMTKSLLYQQPSPIDSPSLLSLLHDAPVVGGYDKCFQRCLLTDLLAVDVKVEWGALTQRALECGKEDRFRLMFLLGLMAFSQDANLDLLHKLISFAMFPEVKELSPPQFAAYFHFRADGAPPSSYLVSFMEKAKMPFLGFGFKKRSQLVIAENHHEKYVENSCEALAASIQTQWPNPEIDIDKLVYVDPSYLDVTRALEDLIPEWRRLTRNHELAMYLEQAQALLDRSTTAHGVMSNPESKPKNLHDSAPAMPKIQSSFYPSRDRYGDDLSMSSLLQQPIRVMADRRGGNRPIIHALVPRSSNTLQGSSNTYLTLNQDKGNPVPLHNRPSTTSSASQTSEVRKLRKIVDDFRDITSSVQTRYADEMDTSIDALQLHMRNHQHATAFELAGKWITAEQIRQFRDNVKTILESVGDALASQDPQSKWLRMVDLWPQMTVTGLLTELRSTSGLIFGTGTKEALVALGLAVTKLQQTLRIHDAQKRRKEQQQRDEWANQGHTNWNPLEYTDWLLLEVDGDIMLREEQVQVALATIAPASGENSVLQLLMGKGKTSCILPMVAAVLANKQDLARIVVPRPLLLQSAQVLQVKLGGLVNREITHIPFSRKTPTDLSLMRLFRQLHLLMRDRGGIMISLPEHLLSFKLNGLQQLADGHVEISKAMLRMQEWLDVHARDVLDECDVSLAIRMQLIYPSGTQTSVDGHPIRWQVIQLLLNRTQDFITAVQSRFRNSVEVVGRIGGGYPLIYFLRKDAEDYLIELLVRDICKGNFPFLPCADFPEAVRDDVTSYISSTSVRSGLVRKITTFFRDKPQLLKVTNLLRGLFVHRILLSSLKKRWNVQYGLHPTRAPIAVPYLAKGVPSVAAEWGHPDVAIILTCLSFYYQGLTLAQFKQAFEQLGKSDDPSVEYARWVFPHPPLGLEDYTAVNAEDGWQLNKLFQLIRLKASLVNFYLNNFVFPQYAKTFSVKLQASGWDLFPLQTDSGCRVTGFSGTNDTRHQLPMLIKQADLPELAHTNAEVPQYLLANRNRGYVRMNHAYGGQRWTELDLIKNLVNPLGAPRAFVRTENKIRILIDAGAQVLEHANRDFAKAWLEEDVEAAAAVYFDDDHRAWVLYRTGNRTPLSASPFADNMDRCVVYMDESHCRGTDLKLPVYGRAALTLGQHLTKDALVQAAMRLRLLGQSQSVTFYSPPEVHQSILDRLDKNSFFHPDSAAVLSWVFGQTCDILEQQEPSYLAQAFQHLQQKQARLSYPDFLEDEHSRNEFLANILMKEFLLIKDLYQPGGTRRAGFNKLLSWDPALQQHVKLLHDRQKQFQDKGSAVHASVLEEVEIEQERELEREIEHEVENVREVQQPPRFRALEVSKLHADVEHFATFGRLVAGSSAYHPMFSILSRTALGSKRSVSASMPSNLWVSTQFSRTVDVVQPNDNFVRPSHWLLWSFVSQKALLVSPEEADALIPILRCRSEPGGVHLIVYAAPVTRRMLHFNSLDYHATPPLPTDFKAPTWLQVELGIFSGRLHLEWHEYAELLSYLGMKPDLSVDPSLRPFAPKPLSFLHEWIDTRRKGQDFEHTPMGFVTTGKPLTENHAFFQTATQNSHADIRPRIARFGSGEEEQEEDKDGDSDHDDDEAFVPVVEHVDVSDSEDDGSDDEDEEFLDAQEHGEDNLE